MGCIGGGLVHSILGARNAPAVSTLHVNLLDATEILLFVSFTQQVSMCLCCPPMSHFLFSSRSSEIFLSRKPNQHKVKQV